MFRKLPPGPVNQLNIELNAKKCFVWLFDTLKMRTNFFLWQIIHWYTQTKHTSGLSILQTSRKLFYPNVFLWIMIFWIWIGSYWLVTASFFTWKEGNLQHFFKDLPAILSLILQYKVPLDCIRLESDMKHSPYFGENLEKFIFSCTCQTIASISTVLLNYLTKYISSHHHIVPSLCTSFLTNCLKPQSNRLKLGSDKMW